MTDKKELNLDELEKVSGGAAYQQDTSNLRGKVGAHIPANEVRNYKGHKVFVISDDDRINWVRGTLTNSYDDTSGCSDRIIHEVDVSYANFWGNFHDMDGNGCDSGRHKFDSDEVTVYLWEDED